MRSFQNILSAHLPPGLDGHLPEAPRLRNVWVPALCPPVSVIWPQGVRPCEGSWEWRCRPTPRL